VSKRIFGSEKKEVAMELRKIYNERLKKFIAHQIIFG
jgi:hypothetical protein